MDSPLSFLELSGLNLDYLDDREIKDAWGRAWEDKSGKWKKMRATADGRNVEIMRSVFHFGLPISVDGIRFKHPTDNLQL